MGKGEGDGGGGEREGGMRKLRSGALNRRVTRVKKKNVPQS